MLLLYGILNLQEKSEAFSAKAQSYEEATRQMTVDDDDFHPMPTDRNYDISS